MWACGRVAPYEDVRIEKQVEKEMEHDMGTGLILGLIGYDVRFRVQHIPACWMYSFYGVV